MLASTRYTEQSMRPVLVTTAFNKVQWDDSRSSRCLSLSPRLFTWRADVLYTRDTWNSKRWTEEAQVSRKQWHEEVNVLHCTALNTDVSQAALSLSPLRVSSFSLCLFCTSAGDKTKRNDWREMRWALSVTCHSPRSPTQLLRDTGDCYITPTITGDTRASSSSSSLPLFICVYVHCSCKSSSDTREWDEDAQAVRCTADVTKKRTSVRVKRASLKGDREEKKYQRI